MARRLTRLRVDEVSAVDKGANNKRFLILKQANPDRRSRKEAGTPGQSNGGTEMLKVEDVKKAVVDGATEVLAQTDERIAKLEAAFAILAAGTATAGEATTTVAKTAEQPVTESTAGTASAEDVAKMVKEGIEEALKVRDERIEKLENAAGERQSVVDEHGAHNVAKSAGGFWEGSGLLL